MMRIILPILLLGVSVASFFFFTFDAYKEIKTLRVTTGEYNTALANFNQLQKVRDTLRDQYNTFSTSDLTRLDKLLPDYVDNIRLVIEIQNMAVRYGLTLTNVKFSIPGKATTAQGGKASPENSQTLALMNKEYGVFELEFSTVGPYENFVKFSKDVEKSLRLVDIMSVGFSSTDPVRTGGIVSTGTVYKYDFKIRTYWLK
jgi:Tfp pilus assembly protein PilO